MDFVASTELEMGQCLKVLRTDSGGEYTGERTQKYLCECGIKHKMTTADTPQHNGIAEHMNCTLVKTTCTLLLDASLPNSFWSDAVQYVAYLHNIVPTWSLNHDITPEEAWSGNKPNIALAHIFRCKAYAHIPEKHRRKLDAKSLNCTFIGYAQNHRAYRLVHRPSGRTFESRDVIFDEGGEQKHYERITFDHDADLNLDSGGETPSVPKTNKEQVVETPAAVHSPPTNMQHSKVAPMPTLATSQPSCTICAPVQDNDERFTTSSYTHKRAAMQVTATELTPDTDEHAHAA